MAVHWNFWSRRLHRWGAILVALPFLLVIVTGILLQLKKDWTWVQPPTARGQGKSPSISFDAILEAVRSQPETEVKSWADVVRVDVQPKRGLVKVTCENRWEVQIDAQTGQVLQTAYRRSDLIEALHDGSWFNDTVKLWIFLPCAMVVLGLWITGIYLFFLPHVVLWRRRRHRAASAAAVPLNPSAGPANPPSG